MLQWLVIHGLGRIHTAQVVGKQVLGSAAGIFDETKKVKNVVSVLTTNMRNCPRAEEHMRCSVANIVKGGSSVANIVKGGVVGTHRKILSIVSLRLASFFSDFPACQDVVGVSMCEHTEDEREME